MQAHSPKSLWSREILLKVPEVTAIFWVIKLVTTAMGEATSDFFVHHMNQYLAVVMGGVVFLGAFWLQFSRRRYVTWVYWLFVTMVAVFGTMVADASRIVLRIPYVVSSAVFAALLAAVLIAWYRVERTLSIHTISTPRREIFYWATVLATFALGTATGDMTARTFHLGYLGSAILFACLFAVPFLARRFWGMAEVFAFWFAYIITRPLGASVADWFGMPRSLSGLGYGRGLVAVVLTALIVLAVGYLMVVRDPARRPADAG